MRQGQQSKRMRGRGRKMPNNLNRVYESNGPDVKIRGTAAHIAEKYQALSRDAHASGDPVAAENYMQHAEHYLRIIAATQAQSQPQQQPQHGGGETAAGEMNGSHEPRGNGAADEAGEGDRIPANATAGATDDEDARQQGGRRRRRGGFEGGPRNGDGPLQAGADDAEQAVEEAAEVAVAGDPVEQISQERDQGASGAAESVA